MGLGRRVGAIQSTGRPGHSGYWTLTDEAAAMLGLVSACPALADTIPSFKSEKAAQKHCPTDEVVWGNSASTVGAFHIKGSKYYGTTQHGAFVCRKEAENGGWHEAKNGQ